jgi:hypothetical protein
VAQRRWKTWLLLLTSALLVQVAYWALWLAWRGPFQQGEWAGALARVTLNQYVALSADVSWLFPLLASALAGFAVITRFTEQRDRGELESSLTWFTFAGSCVGAFVLNVAVISWIPGLARPDGHASPLGTSAASLVVSWWCVESIRWVYRPARSRVAAHLRLSRARYTAALTAWEVEPLSGRRKKGAVVRTLVPVAVFGAAVLSGASTPLLSLASGLEVLIFSVAVLLAARLRLTLRTNTDASRAARVGAVIAAVVLNLYAALFAAAGLILHGQVLSGALFQAALIGWTVMCSRVGRPGAPAPASLPGRLVRRIALRSWSASLEGANRTLESLTSAHGRSNSEERGAAASAA